MMFSSYKHYKKSPITWLGKIPKHWEIGKFSHFFKVAMGKIILKEDLIENGRWPVFSATNEDHYFGYVNEAKVLLNPGDLVIPARGSSIGAVKIVKEPSTTTQTTIYCQNLPCSPVISPYVFYFMQGCKEHLFCFTQTAIPQITVSDVAANPLLIPSIEEQKAIAFFLDKETAKVDEMIYYQQKLIELLKQKKEETLSNAVTKGLNPKVSMKFSGLKWLGEKIPSHWEIKPLKQIVSTPITDGPHETPKFYSQGIPFISAEAVSTGKIDFSKIRGFISREDHQKYSQKYSPKIYDIYMVKSGATTGMTAIVEEKADFNIWSPLAAIRCGKEMNPYFLLYFMRSKNFLETIVLKWSFGIQQNIGMKVIENLLCVVPPMDEQIAIVKYLNTEVQKIDLLIFEIQHCIKLLQEQRKVLIYSAVTGKIEVPHELSSIL